MGIKELRRKLYDYVSEENQSKKVNDWYDTIMLLAIILSIIPLCFKQETAILSLIENITFYIFVIDYLIRFLTSDYKLKEGIKSFVLYPFTPMALTDLISILPSIISSFFPGFKVLKIARMVRIFKTMRVLKFVRYSKNIEIIINVIEKEKYTLLIVAYIAIGYIFLSGLVMFQAESESFSSFFDALYWSTTALTTVGYGDIYPVTIIGKFISMISSFIGIAIVALPAGIVTSGFISEISQNAKL